MRHSRLGGTALAALALWSLLWAHAPLRGDVPVVLEAHFIDVGQGDAAWVRLGSDDLLVDGGTASAGPTVVAYLQGHGVDRIELLVATHPHADHVGGLVDVVDALAVDEAWISPAECDNSACAALEGALAAREVPAVAVRAGHERSLGGAGIRVVHPSEPLYADANENSVVLRLTYGLVRLLLTGDAEAGAEARMLSGGEALLGAEILKVAHHGSASSSGPEFLAAVGPREAVISVGPNSYGHPSPTTLARLAAAGARIWRTDEVGNVVVTTRGSTYSVSGAPHGTAAPPTVPPLITPTASPTPPPRQRAYLVVIFRAGP